MVFFNTLFKHLIIAALPLAFPTRSSPFCSFVCWVYGDISSTLSWRFVSVKPFSPKVLMASLLLLAPHGVEKQLITYIWLIILWVGFWIRSAFGVKAFLFDRSPSLSQNKEIIKYKDSNFFLKKKIERIFYNYLYFNLLHSHHI